jgi:hypothetical protein
MNISSKIILGFVFVASVIFMYLAARTLKTHEHWRNLYNQAQQNIDQRQEQIELAQYGKIIAAGDELEVQTEGLRQLKVTAAELLARRGRVWEGVRPFVQGGAEAPAVEDNGTVRVVIDPLTVNTPIIPGDERKAVTIARDIRSIIKNTPIDDQGDDAATPRQPVYLIDQAPVADGGRFLGIFEVIDTQIDPDSKYVLATLRPLLKDTPTRAAARQALVKRVRDAAAAGDRADFAIYEILPRDRAGLFAGLSEAELRDLFPDELVPRYLNAQDRRIIDFESLLVQINAEEARLENEVDVRETDVGTMKKAVASQQAMLANRQTESSVLKDQVDAVAAEVSAVEQALATIQQQVEQTQSSIDATFSQNQELASRLSVLQQRAVEQAQEAPADSAATPAQTTSAVLD